MSGVSWMFHCPICDENKSAKGSVIYKGKRVCHSCFDKESEHDTGNAMEGVIKWLRRTPYVYYKEKLVDGKKIITERWSGGVIQRIKKDKEGKEYVMTGNSGNRQKVYLDSMTPVPENEVMTDPKQERVSLVTEVENSSHRIVVVKVDTANGITIKGKDGFMQFTTDPAVKVWSIAPALLDDLTWYTLGARAGH